MSVPARHPLPDSDPVSRRLRRLAAVRAAAAFLWAAAFVVAVGSRVPTTHSDVPLLAAVLLSSYPLIDAAASFVAASWTTAARARRALQVNAALSAAAAAVVGGTAFGADAGAALAAFGAWAALSGALQFGMAVARRRAGGGQIPMLVSGGLSTVAGVGFLSAAGMEDADLTRLGGYMALGAVLYVASTVRRPLTLRGAR